MRSQECLARLWSGRLDSNQRLPAPEAGALPGCATPRYALLSWLVRVISEGCQVPVCAKRGLVTRSLTKVLLS